MEIVHAKGQEVDAFRIPFLVYTFVIECQRHCHLWTLGLSCRFRLRQDQRLYTVNSVSSAYVSAIRLDSGLFPGHKPPETSTIARSES